MLFLVILINLQLLHFGRCNDSPTKPNILLFLTDDQDVFLNGMTPMRQVEQLIGAAGATFKNAFTTSPLCCPSRASLLSGMYAHNHGTTNNSISGGCNSDYWREKVEPWTLPNLLKEGGYDTFLAGKYLNQYLGAEVPPGWVEFYGLHGNSRYYNYTLRENSKNVSYSDVYLTDLLRQKTLNFLSSRSTRSNGSPPFFAMVAPPAPHAPFTPAERHRNAFNNIKALRTPNFNRESGLKEKHWLVGSSKKIPNDTITLMDFYFQQRWESLLAVDELVADAITFLKQQNQLDNTFIIYTSDNGFHVGQFAQPYDKRQPYETDIRVPLLIRGPNVPQGVFVTAPVALIDLLPTILEWGQLPILSKIDGQSLGAFLSNAADYDALLDKQFHRGLLVEYWGEGNLHTYHPECPWPPEDRLSECTLDADCHCQDAWNNTYNCIRHFRHQVDRLYCEFADDEDFVEVYDVGDDPYQMRNICYDMLPIERAIYSLALTNLTRCAGASSCSDIIL